VTHESPLQVVLHAKAAAECRGLPERAAVALWETLVAVARDPANTTHPDALIDDDPAFRYALFDDGDGAVHLRVDYLTRTVTVHSVTWIG
jgi:hypothetical protein